MVGALKEITMANGSFTDYLSGGQWGSLSPAIGRMALSQMPQAAYLGSEAAQRFGAKSPRKSRYVQRAYGDVYGDYLGKVGEALTAGRAPTTFEEFLKADDPFTKRYSQLPQYERGVTQTTTNPRTRFIFY